MALRDQPYLPLYIQDIMTDEKLNECCAATHGIFIKGIMCLMHKSEEYGKIVLKQKDQQTDNTVRNFAIKIKKHTPYTVEEIEAALFELLAEKVLTIEGQSLCQKRMIHDNAVSEAKKKAGLISAETKKKKRKKSVATKRPTPVQTETPTDSENEVEYEIENEDVIAPDRYGKSENYFHGPVPQDLRNLAESLKPSSADSEAWQRQIATQLTYLGYDVVKEIACEYPDKHRNIIEGFIDLRVVKDDIVVCIECDNRVTTRDSLVKILEYGKMVDPAYTYAGMILLRDPKPSSVHTISVALEPKPMTVSNTLEVNPQLLESVFDQATRENLIVTYRDIDVDDQWEKFKTKVNTAKKFYALHDLEGLRLAFQRHLQNAPKKRQNVTNKNDRSEFNQNELSIITGHVKKS